jgi:hypothetical protein
MLYRIGKIKSDRYWIQCPDGRMLQLNTDAKTVLMRLAHHESIDSISNELDVEKEEIAMLLNLLGLEPGATFQLIDDVSSEHLSDLEHVSKPRFFNPWIEQRWFTWGIIAATAVSILVLVLFFIRIPPSFVSGLKNQWIIAGCLTLAVLLHEAGHLLTMPRHRNVSIFIQWSGPLPMLSILCNEAWKLSKRQRMRINAAGFVTDLIVCGIAAGLGLGAEPLSPWIWTFLLIHLIRMIFTVWPLLPGDGYWMLVDGFEQPNLWSNAIKHLKQCKRSWLSLYAAARMLFYLFIWLLYAYVIYYWSDLLANRPFEEAIHLLLHPAPLFVSLTLLSQLVLLCSSGFKRWKKWRQTADRSDMNL